MLCFININVMTGKAIYMPHYASSEDGYWNLKCLIQNVSIKNLAIN